MIGRIEFLFKKAEWRRSDFCAALLQALETYPAFLALSLIGGLGFPLTCALGGLLWSYARFKWADGYPYSLDFHIVFTWLGWWVGWVVGVGLRWVALG